MSLPAGLLGALMSGGPLPLPSIPCALCLAIDNNELANPNGDQGPSRQPPAFVSSAKTLAAGWLVCEFHAEVLAHQLARKVGPFGVENGATGETIERTPMLADSFTLPPAVMP